MATTGKRYRYNLINGNYLIVEALAKVEHNDWNTKILESNEPYWIKEIGKTSTFSLDIPWIEIDDNLFEKLLDQLTILESKL